MKIKVSNNIQITNPSDTVLRWCKGTLVVDNPDYYKKSAIGKYVGNIPDKIYLYERRGLDLLLPFGCLNRLWQMCGRNSAWEPLFADLRHVNYTSNINLYPYQEKAVDEALKRKNGILVMPCGSGKTQCGLEIISRIGGRALWLTHTHDLLNQSKKRAESTLDIDGTFGTITAGRVNIGTHITFATVQTLCKVDLAQLRNEFDVIIVDEAQHCCGSPTKVTQFYKVMSNLSARYKIGLTATPRRSDGLEICMFALLGGIMHEVTKEEVAHTTCPVKIKTVKTAWFPDYEDVSGPDGTIDYHAVINNMIDDADRFDLVLSNIPHDGPTLVLGNRIEYLQRLCNYYKGKALCLSGMGNSKKAKKQRNDALEALNNGELDCLFASYKLASEGLDVPSLKYVVFATPEKDPTCIQQSAGRVGRKAEGKTYGMVIDFVDEFGMYKTWRRKRESVYKKLGYDII